MYAHDGGVTTASERAMRLGFTGTLGLGCFGFKGICFFGGAVPEEVESTQLHLTDGSLVPKPANRLPRPDGTRPGRLCKRRAEWGCVGFIGL